MALTESMALFPQGFAQRPLSAQSPDSFLASEQGSHFKAALSEVENSEDAILQAAAIGEAVVYVAAATNGSTTQEGKRYRAWSMHHGSLQYGLSSELNNFMLGSNATLIVNEFVADEVRRASTAISQAMDETGETVTEYLGIIETNGFRAPNLGQHHILAGRSVLMHMQRLPVSEQRAVAAIRGLSQEGLWTFKPVRVDSKRLSLRPTVSRLNLVDQDSDVRRHKEIRLPLSDSSSPSNVLDGEEWLRTRDILEKNDAIFGYGTNSDLLEMYERLHSATRPLLTSELTSAIDLAEEAKKQQDEDLTFSEARAILEGVTRNYEEVTACHIFDSLYKSKEDLPLLVGSSYFEALAKYHKDENKPELLAFDPDTGLQAFVLGGRFIVESVKASIRPDSYWFRTYELTLMEGAMPTDLVAHARESGNVKLIR